EHGLRAVAGLLVERSVDAERRAFGWRVGVGQVDRRAGQGHIAGHARARQWQRGGPEGHLQAVVLGQGEEEPCVAVSLVLHEVERAGIAVRDLARLGQDHLEESRGAPLGRQADPDRVELAQLATEAGDLLGGVQIGEGVGYGADEDGATRVGREEPIPVLGPGAGPSRTNEADDPHVGAGGSIGAVGVGEEDQRYGRGYDFVGTELPHVELICQERGRRPCRPRMYGVKDGPTHEFERRAASPAKSRFAGICASWVAEAGGAGARRLKDQRLTALAPRASEAEREVIGRIIGGEMRTGVSDGLVLEAIAEAAGADQARTRRAALFLGDLATVAALALT